MPRRKGSPHHSGSRPKRRLKSSRTNSCSSNRTRRTTKFYHQPRILDIVLSAVTRLGTQMGVSMADIERCTAAEGSIPARPGARDLLRYGVSRAVQQGHLERTAGGLFRVPRGPLSASRSANESKQDRKCLAHSFPEGKSSTAESVSDNDVQSTQSSKRGYIMNPLGMCSNAMYNRPLSAIAPLAPSIMVASGLPSNVFDVELPQSMDVTLSEFSYDRDGVQTTENNSHSNLIVGTNDENNGDSRNEYGSSSGRNVTRSAQNQWGHPPRPGGVDDFDDLLDGDPDSNDIDDPDKRFSSPTKRKRDGSGTSSTERRKDADHGRAAAAALFILASDIIKVIAHNASAKLNNMGEEDDSDSEAGGGGRGRGRDIGGGGIGGGGIGGGGIGGGGGMGGGGGFGGPDVDYCLPTGSDTVEPLMPGTESEQSRDAGRLVNQASAALSEISTHVARGAARVLNISATGGISSQSLEKKEAIFKAFQIAAMDIVGVARTFVDSPRTKGDGETEDDDASSPYGACAPYEPPLDKDPPPGGDAGSGSRGGASREGSIGRRRTVSKSRSKGSSEGSGRSGSGGGRRGGKRGGGGEMSGLVISDLRGIQQPKDSITSLAIPALSVTASTTLLPLKPTGKAPGTLNMDMEVFLRELLQDVKDMAEMVGSCIPSK